MSRPINLIDLTQHLPTPLLVIDRQQVRENLRRIQQAVPQAEVFYAVKCNADRRVIETVRQAGAGFEIASVSEAEALAELGVPPERVICLHPIKAPGFLRVLHRQRIDVLAADSVAEIEKMAEHAPGSRIVLRISVSNEGSVFPLSGKFGVEPSEAINLFRHARSRGLLPHGLTIHVGSQCERLATWTNALAVCRELFREASRAGVKLSLLSLGGGLPVPYTDGVLSLEEIGAVIQAGLAKLELPPDCKVTIEPGRAVVASAATLITTVVGLAERAAGKWAYIDAGVYHGLFEACAAGGGIPFPISAQHIDRPPQIYNIGGPTCDSFDLPFEKLPLPELRVGDRFAVHCAGAYSTALSSTFNGFPAPVVYALEELEPG
ncbi:MAG: type III PLP-dependent enzyme [Blastocatellia bacterium]